MSFAISTAIPTCTTSTILSGVDSFGVSVGDAFSATTQKIKDAVGSPVGQGVVGFGLGVGAHKIYGPLTEKIVKFFGVSAILPDPFMGLDLGFKILLTPFVCVMGPIVEEKVFRGDLQDVLKKKLNSFYMNLGFSESGSNTASRVTSVFFASLIFGLVHLTNAIVFWCNPVLFLPQVVAATIMGLVFGLAKEFSGQLHMPIGMHSGNNTLAWAYYIKTSL
jgi:membrane protease YdiL (CAAX protease family)